MKKLIGGLIAVILVAVLVIGGTIGFAGASPASESEPAPTVTVVTPRVELSSKAEVVILGAGFEPGQELRLLFTQLNGVQADIGYSLDPEPVANEIGAWVTLWTAKDGLGRYIKKGLIEAGAYVITVTDAEYSALATAPIAFYEAEE